MTSHNDDILRVPDFVLDTDLFDLSPGESAATQIEVDALHVSFRTRVADESHAAEGGEVDAMILGHAPALVLLPGQDEEGRNILHLDSTGFTISDIHSLLATALDAVCAVANSGGVNVESLDVDPTNGFIVPMGGSGHGH